MSHSQFHSTDLFILRHAWLNLWDKHYWQDQPGILQDTYSKANAQLEVVFTWDTHKALQLSAHYCPSFILTSLK